MDYVITSPLLLQQATVALSKNRIDNRVRISITGRGLVVELNQKIRAVLSEE